MKIKYKILLITVVISLIALMLLGVTSYISMKIVLTEEITGNLIEIAKIQKERLDNLIEQNSERIALIKSRTQLRISLKNYIKSGEHRNIDKINTILNDAKTSIAKFETISVLTLDGKVIASTDSKVIGLDYAAKDFFVKGQKEDVIGSFFLSNTNELMMYLSGPLIYDNQLLGVIAIDANADKIVAFITDYSGLGKTGYTRIIKKIGDAYVISAHRNTNQPIIYFDNIKTIGVISKRSLQPDVFVFEDVIDSQNKRVIAVSNFLEKVGFGLNVRVNYAEAFAKLFYLRNIMITIIIISVILIMVLSLILANSLVKPIVHLAHFAEAISNGNLDEKIIIKSHDEIGLLAQSFNQMSQNLLIDIDKRKRIEEELRQHRGQLEELVYERTADLEKSQQALTYLLEDVNESREELSLSNTKLETQADALQHQNLELEIQRQSLEDSNRFKSEFLSNMSHELRTPLNSIIALSDVLIVQTKDKLSIEENNYLEIVERNSQDLLRLINGILDLAKIEAGRMDVTLTDVSLGLALDIIEENLTPLAKGNGVTLSLQIPDEIPRVKTDAIKLHQVLLNLVGNAIKFSDGGSVNVSLKYDSDNVYFAVKDTGIGISENYLGSHVS